MPAEFRELTSKMERIMIHIQDLEQRYRKYPTLSHMKNVRSHMGRLESSLIVLEKKLVRLAEKKILVTINDHREI